MAYHQLQVLVLSKAQNSKSKILNFVLRILNFRFLPLVLPHVLVHVLVPKLYLGTRTSTKLRFETSKSTRCKASRGRTRSQVQLGNEKKRENEKRSSRPRRPQRVRPPDEF